MSKKSISIILSGIIKKSNQYGIVNNFIPADLARFNSITSNHTVIMSSNKWLSYKNIHNSALMSNRFNIVVLQQPSFAAPDFDDPIANSIGGYGFFHMRPNLIFVNSFDNALSYGLTLYNRDIFIIGGKSIYEQALRLNVINSVYLTYIFNSSKIICNKSIDLNDVFNKYSLINESAIQTWNDHKFKFMIFSKSNESHQASITIPLFPC